MSQFPVEYSSLSSSALLQMVIEKYDVDKFSSITFLKRGFNDTYLIESSNQKLILRVYKYKWRSFESITAEIKLLNELNENKIGVSFPIKDKEANYIQALSAPEGERYAVLFSYADGQIVRKLTTEESYLLGVEMGKFHSFTAKKIDEITAHNYTIAIQFEQILNTLKPILIAHQKEYDYVVWLKEQFFNVFNNMDENEVTQGICHGDFQAENFHITSDNKFTFFDFDFFGTGYLAYDIGVFIWYDHKNKPPEIIHSFLKGYETQRKLSKTEIELLPYFSTLRALFQMNLYCKISDGKQLPLWPAKDIAAFINKVERWYSKAIATKFNLR